MNDAKELLKSGKVDLPDVNAIDSSARMVRLVTLALLFIISFKQKILFTNLVYRVRLK
jgi:hypothetical protein